MDDFAFDRLTRAFAAPPSRRTALRLLAGTALGGLIASFEVAEVEADFPGKCKKDSQCGPGAKCVGFKKRKRGKKGRPGKCRCGEGLSSCPGTPGCVDLLSANTNCGACGNVCQFDTSCQAGRCQTGRGCEQGATLCNAAVQCGPLVEGSNSIRCVCMTSLETGRTACSDITVPGAGCSTCTTDAECTTQLGGTPGICSPGGPNCENLGTGCPGSGPTPNLCTALGCLGTTSLSAPAQP